MKNNESAVRVVRAAHSEAADDRRQIAALSAIGLIDFSVISLYQLGVIKSLPDLPGELFDSNTINAANDAQVMGIPDGPVSLSLYAANVLLAAGAIKSRKRGNVFDWLLAGSVLGQAAGGAYYLYNMAAVQKKVCVYCVTGALLNFATLAPLAQLFFRK
ncbi:hypothetical protein GCM10023187_16100 [Nibrella viscosa]|uniref:Vitamin K epoxide reductase domain-containing protein n=1 Tax=Nibrella viscosa TaxID=1084524 RepID=A0ABP8K7I2_9BACT